MQVFTRKIFLLFAFVVTLDAMLFSYNVLSQLLSILALGIFIFLVIIRRYQRCPSNHLLSVYVVFVVLSMINDPNYLNIIAKSIFLVGLVAVFGKTHGLLAGKGIKRLRRLFYVFSAGYVCYALYIIGFTVYVLFINMDMLQDFLHSPAMRSIGPYDLPEGFRGIPIGFIPIFLFVILSFHISNIFTIIITRVLLNAVGDNNAEA